MVLAEDNKSVTYGLANSVLGYVTPNPDGSKEVGIMVIIAIIGLLIQAYRCWKDNPWQAAEACRNPTNAHYRMLRLTVRRAVGWRMFLRKGDEIMDGLIALGPNITEDKIIEVLKEHGVT